MEFDCESITNANIVEVQRDEHRHPDRSFPAPYYVKVINPNARTSLLFP